MGIFAISAANIDETSGNTKIPDILVLLLAIYTHSNQLSEKRNNYDFLSSKNDETSIELFNPIDENAYRKK